MEYGPIQLVIIEFENNDKFTGAIARELATVRSRGTIRLIDALAVTKKENGEVVTLQESDFSGDEAVELNSAIQVMLGANGHKSPNGARTDAALSTELGFSAEEVKRAIDELEPGMSALYLLFEHTWAAGLKYAVRNAGGIPVAQGFLTPELAMMIGAEVQAVVDAEATMELANAVKGAALLDAIIMTEEAVTAATQAVEQAEEIVATAKAVREAAAAEAIRALIVSEILDDAAAELAAESLVAAGMIDPETLASARATADAVAEEVRAMTR